MFVRTMRGELIALAAVERLWAAEGLPAECGRLATNCTYANEDCSFAELRTSAKVS